MDGEKARLMSPICCVMIRWRPVCVMTRAIRDHIRQPLADELLFGQLADGGTLVIDVKDGEFVFEFPDK